MNIPRYVELKKGRVIIPSKTPQLRPEGEKSHPGKEPPSEPHKAPPGPSYEERPGSYRLPQTEVTGKPVREKTGDLTRIGSLFNAAWDIYKRRFLTLIALYLLSALFFAVAFGVFFGTGFLLSTLFPASKTILIAIGSVAGGISGCLAMVWGFAAFLCAVSDETLGIRESLEYGSRKIWSFLWLFSLLGFLITGGFLLFIIPGILFSVWFFLSQFILVRENERGMNALLKSKEYAKGYWFDLFLRLFIIWFISAAVGMIPFIGPIVSFLYMPFMMIFMYLIYDDLKTLKGDVAYISSPGEKLKWIGAGLLGYVLAIVIIVAFLGAYLASSLFLLKGAVGSKEYEIFMPKEEQPAPSQPVPFSPESTLPAFQEKTPVESDTTAQNVLVYIYSLNYKGMVRLNGEELYEIKGEKDMNYNYTGGGRFHYGKNLIDVEYSSLPEPWKAELKIKVYRNDWDNGKEDLLNEWVINDEGGRKSFEITVSR